MAKNALCFKCGGFKQGFGARCESCGFEPKEDLDFAKSRVLDAPWAFTLPSGDTIETGRTPKELRAISEQIRGGTPFVFPQAELDGVLSVYVQWKTTPRSRVLRDGLRWLIPPLLLMLVFVLILVFSRR